MTALSIVTADGHDTATALTLIIFGAICLAFWALAENLLTRGRRREEERDAIAETVGLIDRRRAAPFMGEFADEIEQRLADRGDAS